MNLPLADFRLNRLIAALLSRKGALDTELARFDHDGPKDSYGRPSFACKGADRARLQQELRQVAEWLAIASEPTEG